MISAAWARADVSDNLIAQTIVRLRRSLGDAGNERHCIRSVPRAGYRWMLETEVVLKRGEFVSIPPRTNGATFDDGHDGTHVLLRAKRLRPALLVALAHHGRGSPLCRPAISPWQAGSIGVAVRPQLVRQLSRLPRSVVLKNGAGYGQESWT